MGVGTLLFKGILCKISQSFFLAIYNECKSKGHSYPGLVQAESTVATSEKPEYRRPYALTRLELLMGGIFPWRAFLRLRFWIFIVQS